ncbi:MAG TPA: Gfo/Idh/MocA family oxidoreductase [Acidimicrobiales bacterium]|nr:Gfo/Idh/MocA family oxidoreductase [Acidimicrobiales bacterium]
MSERRRVAVVGLGIGLAHVVAFKQLKERYEIVAVCDPDADRAQATVSGLRGVEIAGFDDLVARNDIEVVSICTPPHLHLAQCRAVLESGKHAICEKPLVGSLRDVDELVALEAATGRWVMPVYQYRYGAGVQRVRHLLDSGVAGDGRAAAAEVSWRRRPEYYAGWRGRWATELGGALVSHALHSLDLMTLLLGPAERVFARLATLTNPVETEDTVAITLQHAGGALSTLSATLGSTPELSRLRLTYERMTAESNHEPYEFPGEPWVVTGDTDEDHAAIEAALEGFQPGPEGWVGQFAAFDEALAKGFRPPVTLADARAGLEVVTAGYRSARTGTDVELPLSPDDEDHGGWWL